MGSRPTIFYGWVMVALTTVAMMLVYGVRHSFSVFFPPILDEFGWTRASTALMFSLNIFIYGLAAPLVGGMGAVLRPRRIMPVGGGAAGSDHRRVRFCPRTVALLRAVRVAGSRVDRHVRVAPAVSGAGQLVHEAERAGDRPRPRGGGAQLRVRYIRRIHHRAPGLAQRLLHHCRNPGRGDGPPVSFLLPVPPRRDGACAVRHGSPPVHTPRLSRHGPLRAVRHRRLDPRNRPAFPSYVAPVPGGTALLGDRASTSCSRTR